MFFGWSDFLILAENLANGPDPAVGEASLRTAISRAYYAAFGESREYAVAQLGFVPTRKPEDHKRLRDVFEKAGMYDVAQSLNRLRGWRNDCDYDSTIPVSSVYCVNAIATAKKVLLRLQN